MIGRCLAAFAACICVSLPPWTAADAPEALAASRDSHRFEMFLAQCRARYATVDGRIERARVRDVGYFPVPGYPYLRTDRLMSSYRGELDGLDKFGAWMLQLREYDSLAREDELANLGIPKAERAALLSDLRLCAVWLSFAELNDAASRDQLLRAARLSDQPHGCPAGGSSAALRVRRRTVSADFERAQASAPLPLLWQAAPSVENPSVESLFHDASRDELGRLGLPMGEWDALAAAYAPRLLFDGRGATDRPGRPELRGHRATVDPEQPVVHYQVDYARLHGRTVVQIEYFLWFQPRDAAAVDGLIWRVTLDEQGHPLLYSSVRADGHDPLWFPTQSVQARNADGQAGPQMPQPTPPPPFALRLGGSNHRLVQLTPLVGDVVAPQRRSYALRPYEELLVLPDGGGTRSLFDSRGVVRGAASPQGCPAGDAARQWGHLPVSIGGRGYYFDDPYLIEKLFIVPEAAGERARR